ncbi:hypothetical protein [Streptomyces sp. NPDC005507]
MDETVCCFRSDEGRGKIVVGILGLLEAGEQSAMQWLAEFTC